jgi:trans-aconitate 2-methyltransferase
MSDHPTEIAGTHWNPDHYARFSTYRLRPAIELLQRVNIENPQLVYDLGCGSGEVTGLISKRWPSASVIGVDASSQMLDKARHNSTQVKWQLADITTWSPVGVTNLIYSNAALHWLPDHSQLLPRLMGYLVTGGVLAIQMPRSWDLPSHQLMRETLFDCGSTGVPLGGQALSDSLAHNWVEDTDVYYDALACGSTELDIWETRYVHVLSGQDAVYQWVEATGLRPVLKGLSETERQRFIPEYQARLRHAYPVRTDGSVLYSFKRLFVVAKAKGPGLL